jgi:hypothetical protein
MYKCVAASLLLLLFLSSNIWSLELCTTLSNGPDCCRDGFCPHHGHIESAQDPDGKDCVCKISSNDHELLILSVSGPAIIATKPTRPAMQISRLVAFAAFSLASFDQSTLTPPPKA